jgi:GTP-binding protein
VGRPNVGKSTLLNALSRDFVSIVEPTPGVTRDRVGVVCTLAGRTVEVVDTGGIGIVDAQGLGPWVEAQVDAAIAAADVILFVVDAREGVAVLDRVVAERLRKARAPVVLLANKGESARSGWNVGEFPVLGFGEPIVISAQEGMHLDAVEAAVAARMPEGTTTPPRIPPPAMKLAFVGRVNAGKSSLVNRLAREERMIVSEIPGTTRDSVDVRLERDGEVVVVIDTAGIRKERAVQNSLEFYAKRRAERAMRRADVTALVIDATTEVARLDREIAGYAVEQHHPVVVVVNKWDRVPAGVTTSEYVAYLSETLPHLAYAPILFVSAKTGRGVTEVLDVARSLHRQATTRVSTAALNKAIEAATTLRRPKPHQGKVGRVYYGSQVETTPPTFVLFVDDPARFPASYTRYLENRFRETLPFPEIPLLIRYKARMRSPSKNLLGPREE